jgi:two-component system, OmpR family, alkaline phosphatase synthesis response regulator PhoP
MSSRILLIEDEPGLVLTLSDLFANEGYDVETASDGPSGLAKAMEGGYDLIILDVMLPGKNGFDVCREMRENGIGTGVLMLTARTQVADRVEGLKLGADDYLTKPFAPSELLARAEALLRRVNRENPSTVVRFRFSDVQIDFEKREVSRNGASVSLATKELQLLRYLVENRDKVIPRDELLKNVWEYQPTVSSRTVDVHIAWLRQKLEPNSQTPRHFHTVRGVGYRFTP